MWCIGTALDSFPPSLLSAVVGFLLGLVSTIIGVAFIEPFRARMSAYLEFGKWLAILPLELKQMQGMTKHIVTELAQILAHAQQNQDWLPVMPHPIDEQLEVETVLEVRTHILGWKRSEETFSLVTEIWSAIVRTNWALRIYNQQIAELPKIDLADISQTRKQRLRIMAKLHDDFTVFGMFAEQMITRLNAMLKVWDEDAPKIRSIWRRSPKPEWKKKGPPISVEISYDKANNMPSVKIVNTTIDMPVVIQSVVATCGLSFYNVGLGFFPLEPVTLLPKTPFTFRIDLWNEPSAVVQSKWNKDKAMNDVPFTEKSAYEVFRSLAHLPPEESWVEVQYNGEPSTEFLRGKVKWAFEAAVTAASEEQKAQLGIPAEKPAS